MKCPTVQFLYQGERLRISHRNAQYMRQVWEKDGKGVKVWADVYDHFGNICPKQISLSQEPGFAACGGDLRISKIDGRDCDMTQAQFTCNRCKLNFDNGIRHDVDLPFDLQSLFNHLLEEIEQLKEAQYEAPE